MIYSLLDQGEIQSNLFPFIKAFYQNTRLDQFFGVDIAEKFTSDRSVIENRLELFADLAENPSLYELLEELCSKLSEYSEVRTAVKAGNQNEQNFYQMLDAELYVQLIELMQSGFSKVINNLHSVKLKAIADYAESEAGSEGFKLLKNNLENMKQDILHVKSITIGVNLNTYLMPKEAGLVSINTESYRSGDYIDRLLRMDFKQSPYHCLASLTNYSSEFTFSDQQIFNGVVLRAMSKVLSDTLKKCKASQYKFISEKLDCLVPLGREIQFIMHARYYIKKLEELGVPLCVPKISTDNTYSITKMYPFSLYPAPSAKSWVTNNVTFDEKGKVFLLTGPNSGGKTVFIRSLAICQGLFQLGLPIPAQSAEMPVLQGLFTMFPHEQEEGSKFGRLEEECRQMSELLSLVNENSLVLMDETFSSTSAKEAIPLAESCLEKLLQSGCYAVFSTHLHELSDYIKNKGSDSGLDLLAVEIKDGERTYKVRRGYAEKSSDAQAIAKKYGLI